MQRYRETLKRIHVHSLNKFCQDCQTKIKSVSYSKPTDFIRYDHTAEFHGMQVPEGFSR